tara:strand:+ start:2123 stop:2299 length:177 start_codon:yes stop_codon:yes gene_type:complete
LVFWATNEREAFMNPLFKTSEIVFGIKIELEVISINPYLKEGGPPGTEIIRILGGHPI